MNRNKTLLGCLLLAGGISSSRGDAAPVLYRLTGASTFSYELPDPEPKLVVVPVRGVFFLGLRDVPPWWQQGDVTQLALTANDPAGQAITIRGSGWYEVGGDFVLMQQLQLQTTVNGLAVDFDSGTVPPQAGWPIIDITVKAKPSQVGLPGAKVLHLVAVPELQRWHYRLVDGSAFMDDCPVCDRLSVWLPLRGSFDLVLYDQNPLFSRYHVFDAAFATTSPTAPPFELFGEGEYQQGGEVAVEQDLTLDLQVRSPFETRFTSFTNVAPTVLRVLPMLGAYLDETNGTPGSTYRLQVRAAPFREAWFTTTRNFTPGNPPGPVDQLTSGDVLADTGRLVRANRSLLQSVGVDVPGNAVGVDALEAAPGGELWFSLVQPVVSKTLGSLSAGDLVSDQGRLVKRNAELVWAFGLMPPVPEVGLDAVQTLASGEILFSITQDAFSELSGVKLRRGDVLSANGYVFRAAADLLSGFLPAKPGEDYGLDALHVWPSGEVWFSTENGFTSADPAFGTISDGDLLSYRGYLVARNRDLLGAFAPLETATNFGLASLFVVTDTTAPAGNARLNAWRSAAVPGALELRWTGAGRVFQVERTLDLWVPFAPLGPVQTELTYTDASAATANPAFYRVRQW